MTIIRHSGVVFEGDQGRKYASVISGIVQNVQAGLEEVSGGQEEGVSVVYLGYAGYWIEFCSRCTRSYRMRFGL